MDCEKHQAGHAQSVPNSAHDKDGAQFTEQGRLLLFEATASALALANASESGMLSEPEDTSVQQATALPSLLQRLLQFGLKQSAEIGTAAGSPLYVIQALEASFEGSKAEYSMLPTAAAILPSSCHNSHSMNSSLHEYLHACITTRRSSALFSALLKAKETVVAARYHAWAPVRGRDSSLEELLDALKRLDCAPQGHGILQQSEHERSHCVEQSSAVDVKSEASCGYSSQKTGCVREHVHEASPDSSASHQTHAAALSAEEAHACTDADISKHDYHSFDTSVMHSDSSRSHALAADENSQHHSNKILAVGGQAFDGCTRTAASLSDCGQECALPSSPPSMQSRCSFHSMAPPGATASLLMQHSASTRPQAAHAATVQECDLHSRIFADHASLDATLLQQPATVCDEQSMHEQHEPVLPCSSMTGTCRHSCTLGSQAGSLKSSFSSPRKDPSSHFSLAMHQPGSLSLSQELLLPTDIHEDRFSGRLQQAGRAVWGAMNGGRLPWASTAGGAHDVQITVGEFYVLEDSHSSKRHAEFEVATSVAGREIARVTRRFRQIRTLQQQLRGSYRRGNLDLFLPSPGHGVLPSSWAEITRAAVTTIGAARTAPSTLAGRQALLQRCLSDLVEQRPHLLEHAAALEFLGLRRRDPPCMGDMHTDSMLDQCTASPISAAPQQMPEDDASQHIGAPLGAALLRQSSLQSTFGGTAGGALLGGLTLGQEPPIDSRLLRSRSSSPTKGMRTSTSKSPGQTPNESVHHGTAYDELLGSLNLEGSCSDLGIDRACMPPLHTSASSAMHASHDIDVIPRISSRHFKMIVHEPHELQLSEAELARRQQGMCVGCMRALGAVHEVAHKPPVDTWRCVLQSRSSLVDPSVWEQGSLGGRALETLGSIQNLLVPKHRTEKPRRCFYDGGLYCEECHAGQVSVIPSRIVTHWDFRKHPVSCDAFDFLQATRGQPLVRFDDATQECFFMRAPLLRDTTATRRRIAALVATLSEPSAPVVARDAALRLRVAAGHKAHLIEGHDLWSVLDLQDLAQGAAFAKLPSWLSRMEAIAGVAAANGMYACRHH